MMIHFLSTNPGKLKEAELALRGLPLELHSSPMEMVEPGEGTTEDVALAKLKQAVTSMGLSTAAPEVWVADDAGIYFNAYPSFPGIYTKRCFQGIGYKGMMKLLEGENRQAYFEGVLAVYWKGQYYTFKAQTHGTIAASLSDAPINEGFPFNSVFIPEGTDRVLAEMTEEERLHYSYRRKAFQELGHWLLGQEDKKDLRLSREEV